MQVSMVNSSININTKNVHTIFVAPYSVSIETDMFVETVLHIHAILQP